jgi:hypothetical protein
LTASELTELRAILIDVVTRQTQIEQGLHMLLDALNVHLPLITEMSNRINGISLDLATIAHDVGSLAGDVEDIRSDLEGYKTGPERDGE